MTRQSKQVVTLGVRMPPQIHQQLTQSAQKMRRSLNSEIVYRLGETFGEDWEQFKKLKTIREKTEQELVERVLADPGLMKILREVMKEER